MRSDERPMASEQSRMDDAIVLNVIRAVMNDPFYGTECSASPERMERTRAALLASLPVLLGEPVAFRYRDSDVFGDECWRYLDLAPLGQYAETQRLYAPSLGEGDGR